MDQIIISNENNNLQYVCYRKTRQGYKEENISYKSLKEYINYLSENKHLLGPITIEGSDLSFSSDKYIIKLVDYKDFKNKKRFSFVFDKLRNKKIKLYKEKYTKPVAIVLAAIATLGISGHVITGLAENTDKENPRFDVSSEIVEEQTYGFEDSVTEDDFVLPQEVKSQTEFTTTHQETKAQSQTEIIPQETTVENNRELSERLCIGNKCDDEKAITARNLYYPLFEKYAEKYGLDVELVCAIATQERGVHSSTIDVKGAIGIMQVQVNVWNNETIYAYDYLNDKQNVVHINLDDLRNVENNIEVGCMIFQNYLNEMNGNVIAALQSYNNGTGTVNNTIRSYCYSCGKTKDEVLEENDLGWLSYRTSANPGDPSYIEHVLRYYTGNINNLINNGISR